MTLLLERLQSSTAIVDSKGQPTAYFLRFMQVLCDTLEANDVAQQEAIDAIAAAQAAANAAQAAADAAEAAAILANGAALAADTAAADANTAANAAQITADAAESLAADVEARINAFGVP